MNLRSFLGRFNTVFLLSAFFLLHPTFANAQIDPTLYFLKERIAADGLKSPIFGPSNRARRGGVDETGAQVLLRFHAELSTPQIRLLEQNGVQFERASGDKDQSIRHNQTLYRAQISWAAIDFLASYPHLIRAEAGWAPGFLHPLDQTSQQVGASAANILPKLGVQGQGMLIGNIDSGIDVMHPAFFHADGGLFNWIDVNNNGVFDPGIDAVDLNHNGIADRNEILRVLDGAFVKDFDDPKIQNYDGILQTKSDWLYADSNNDRERNSGRTAGFDEQMPAYGEPLFVVDDVNGNGQLDVGEKLVRLKTSKIRKFVDGDTVYRRGIDLIESADPETLQFAYHGTGVAGILVGGQPGFHDRIGIAPAADLIVYSSRDENWETTIAASFIEDAIAEKADVLLHEWTECFSRAMDGSSNLEAAMDRAREAGVLQVNPAGNLNFTKKSARFVANSSEITAFSFAIDDAFHNNDPSQPYSAVFGSIQWRDGTVPKISLQPPGSAPQPIEFNAVAVEIANGFTQWTYEQTSRGTHVAKFFIWTEQQGLHLPLGQWQFHFSDVSEESVFWGRVSDYYSGWNGGISWLNSTANETTLCFPATADSAIAVAAHGGRHDSPGSDDGKIGELRGYSGRGPRIDGRPQIMMSAPDDPYAPIASMPQMQAAGWGQSWYGTFGGTSGAGPHVAASLALLREHYPDLLPDQLETKLYESADRENLVPEMRETPDHGWGWGKLNIFRALYDRPVPENNAPKAALKITRQGDILILDASESIDPDGDSLEYRFDINYDGNWEIDWSSNARTEIPSELLHHSPPYVRLEVRDPNGATASALSLPGKTEVSHDPPDVGHPTDTPDADYDTDFTENIIKKAPSDSCSCKTVAQPPTFPVYLLLASLMLLMFRWIPRKISRSGCAIQIIFL